MKEFFTGKRLIDEISLIRPAMGKGEGGKTAQILSQIPGLDFLNSKLDSATKHVSGKAYQSMDKLYSNILASPAMVIIILVIISGFFAQQAMSFQEQIEGFKQI